MSYPEHASSDTLWCQGLFAMLKDGGTWGVPRSGLIFQKQGPELVLKQMMPHDERMPVTTEQVKEMQESDYEEIRKAFVEAGIPVRREDT